MALTPRSDEIADNILAVLPEDGTPVVNRIMRAMLSKRLSRSIPTELYFNAVGVLASRGAIGRARGRGGSIFLVANGAATKPEVKDPEPQRGQWSEAALMEPVRRYLEQIFVKTLDLPAGSSCFAVDTSNVGPREGQWARPDFVLVTVMNFQLLPGSQLDVHSFELKNEAGGSVQAVHEALAQTRFTHFGHLIWHVPPGSKAEAKLPEIEAHCDKHGIGLVVIRDPNDFDTWEVLLDPKQADTDAATIDAFLISRMTEAQRANIRNAVQGIKK